MPICRRSVVGAGVWLLLVAVGCGGGSEGSADSERLTEICRTTTNMPAGVCDCVGEKASKDLSPDALAFLVASMDKKTEVAESLRGKLTLEEMTKAGMFFATAPASCAAPAKDGE